MTTTLTAPSATQTCSLDIGGMTCASCVGRVEKALTRLDGVSDARVNLATETATVDFDPQRVGPSEFAAAAAKAGYTATPRHEEPAAEAPAEASRQAEKVRKAEAHRAEVEKKNAERTKPRSAPLPPPPP